MLNMVGGNGATGGNEGRRGKARPGTHNSTLPSLSRDTAQLSAKARAGATAQDPSKKHRKDTPDPTHQAETTTSNVKNALTAPSKIKKVLDAFVEARSLEDAGTVAQAAESLEVTGEEIESEVADAAQQAGAAVPDVAAAASTAANGEAGAFTAIGHAIKGGLGALGLVAGSVQALYGGKELHEGHVLKGSADLIGGALNVAAGVSQVSSGASSVMAGGFSAMGAVEEIGTKIPVAGPLVGAANIVTGGVQVYQSLEHGQTSQAISGGVKTIGGTVMVAGVFLDGTIAGAPAGVVLNAVGGAMILGATAWEQRQAIGSGLSWTGRHIAAGFEGLGHDLGL